MALDFDWFGLHETPARGIKYAVRCTATETVTATINGVASTLEADTTVDDGVVVFTWAELTPATEYRIAASAGGVSVSRIIQTLPETGTIIGAWASCIDPANRFYAAFDMVARGVQFLILQGDSPYCDFAIGGFGESALSVGTDPEDSEIYAAHHRHFRRREGFRHLVANGVMIGYMWDDHEQAGDNWDHRPASAAQGLGSVSGFYGGAPTQAQTDACWLAGRTAFVAYGARSNPAVLAGATAQKPSQADAATPAANYGPLYFQFSIGTRFLGVVVDCLSHRSPVTATDNASKTMLGTTQLGLVKTALGQSFGNKALFSNKKTYNNVNDNGDTWAPHGTNTGYTTERDDLIGSGEDVWLVGDRHTPSVAKTEGHVMVCACPAGQAVNDNQGATYGTNVALVHAGIESGQGRQGWGLITIGDALNVAIVDPSSGIVWSGDVAGGALTYPATLVA